MSKENTLNENNKIRIGGWLIVAAITLITAIITHFYKFIESLTIVGYLIENRIWDTYTKPGNSQYHPLFEDIILLDTLTAIFFSIFALIVTINLFQKKPNTIKSI